jgi:heptosyltransferase I
MHVLIIKPSSLGDIIHTFPVCRIIKHHLPSATITWIVNDNLESIVKLCADVDDTILFKRSQWNSLKNLPDLLSFMRDLRRREFDLVLDLQGLFRSGLCAYLPKAQHTIGFADAREGASMFYDDKIQIPNALTHAIEKNVHLVNHALKTDYPCLPANYAQNDHSRTAVERLLNDRGIQPDAKLIALGVTSRWTSKTWPPDFFASVASNMAAQYPGAYTFWVLGTEEEKDVGEMVCKSSTAEVHNLMGETTLPMMVDLLKRSSAMISNDSGPMHIAASLETPTLGLFGPTDAALTGPYGDRHAVLQSAVDCAPCFKRECPLELQLCRNDVVTPSAACDALGRILSGSADK